MQTGFYSKYLRLKNGRRKYNDGSESDENFSGIVADEAKWRGDKMAAMFLSKIEYYRGSSAQPLV